MPFTFIDIETRQSRKIILLFLTLVIFYFIGFVLIYSASALNIFIESWWRGHLWHKTHGILPTMEATLILLVTAFIAALVHWIFSIRKMIERILSIIGAKPIDPEDRYHLLFKNIVDEVSVATGGIRIEPFVVSSRYLNAFAISDFHGRSIIGISEGMLIKMNRRQLEGIVAHEAGHLVWKDSLLATVSCSMAAVYAGLLRTIFSNQERVRLPASLPVMIAIFLMRVLTLFLNTWISRERELRADATAVRLTRDPLGLAEPLYLI
jgi:heat shock protein HtpX